LNKLVGSAPLRRRTLNGADQIPGVFFGYQGANPRIAGGFVYLFGVGKCEQNEWNKRISLGHGSCSLDAAHARHADVDHYDVGPEFLELRNSGPTVFRFTADLPLARFQNRANDPAGCF
jgi:hypothetical protein